MDSATIATILTAVLAIISTLLGAKYKQSKDIAETKTQTFIVLLKDVITASETVTAAAKDDKVSETEFQAVADIGAKIVADAKEVIAPVITQEALVVDAPVV